MIHIPIVEIIRLETSYEAGTFGKLRINKKLFCDTLEPKKYWNEESVSAIPAGQYTCERNATQLNSVLRLGITETFQIMNVPFRTYVKFHPGNTDDDTEACVLLGQYIEKLRGDRAILNSGNTFKAFMKLLEDFKKFHLTIIENY